MKNILAIVWLMLASGMAFSQVIIGGKTGSANTNTTSVLLDFATNQNKGIILPYVRTLAATPTEGTILVDASTGTAAKVVYYNGGWVGLSKEADITAELSQQPITTEAPDAYAVIGDKSTAPTNGVLVLESATKAMVLPQVASTDDIINPAPGMMVYVNGTNKRLAVFNGDKWSYWAPSN